MNFVLNCCSSWRLACARFRSRVQTIAKYNIDGRSTFTYLFLLNKLLIESLNDFLLCKSLDIPSSRGAKFSADLLKRFSFVKKPIPSVELRSDDLLWTFFPAVQTNGCDAFVAIVSDCSSIDEEPFSRVRLIEFPVEDSSAHLTGLSRQNAVNPMSIVEAWSDRRVVVNAFSFLSQQIVRSSRFFDTIFDSICSQLAAEADPGGVPGVRTPPFSPL